MDYVTFAQSVKRRLSNEFDSVILSEKEYYSHPTYIIKNLSEYIHLITALSSTKVISSFGETVIYRGIADSDYNLLPGLARIRQQEPDTEALLINEFLTRRPDAFSGLSEFDMLAKMQHYGLPTRLLDFSLNPLVALYFACESKNTKPGRVLCHNAYLSKESSEYITAICTSATKQFFDENYTVEEYYCNDKLSLGHYMSSIFLYEETIVVRPKYWNQRITNQAGVFMVFPNNVIDRYKNILIRASEIGLDMAVQEYGRGFINPSIIEEAFQREPIDFYKNENEPYLTDACLRKMLNAYRNYNSGRSFWEKNKQRFSITEKIKPLSRERISNEFCSIIIEPKTKRTILQDLSYIGMGADYIYPELEYTAKEIKKRFE